LQYIHKKESIYKIIKNKVIPYIVKKEPNLLVASSVMPGQKGHSGYEDQRYHEYWLTICSDHASDWIKPFIWIDG